MQEPDFPYPFFGSVTNNIQACIRRDNTLYIGDIIRRLSKDELISSMSCHEIFICRSIEIFRHGNIIRTLDRNGSNGTKTCYQVEKLLCYKADMVHLRKNIIRHYSNAQNPIRYIKKRIIKLENIYLAQKNSCVDIIKEVIAKLSNEEYSSKTTSPKKIKFIREKIERLMQKLNIIGCDKDIIDTLQKSLWANFESKQQYDIWNDYVKWCVWFVDSILEQPGDEIVLYIKDDAARKRNELYPGGIVLVNPNDTYRRDYLNVNGQMVKRSEVKRKILNRQIRAANMKIVSGRLTWINPSELYQIIRPVCLQIFDKYFKQYMFGGNSPRQLWINAVAQAGQESSNELVKDLINSYVYSKTFSDMYDVFIDDMNSLGVKVYLGVTPFGMGSLQGSSTNHAVFMFTKRLENLNVLSKYQHFRRYEL